MATYHEIYDGPPHGYTSSTTAKRYIAIHNTSNDNLASARDEASYAKRRTDRVSSHYYVDRVRVVQSLDTDMQAWHANSRTGNREAISYEITGWNSHARDWWLANVCWDLLARQIAKDCRTHGIDVQALTEAQMRDGNRTGFVTHLQMTHVWGGDHTDPGPGFPMDHLIAKVRAALGAPALLTAEEDDMFATPPTELPNVPNGLRSYTIPPVNSGSVPWGPAWLSVWADLFGGQAAFRVAVGNGVTFTVVNQRVVLESGRLFNMALPTGTRGLSFLRLPATDGDPCTGSVSFMVEYARRQ